MEHNLHGWETIAVFAPGFDKPRVSNCADKPKVETLRLSICRTSGQFTSPRQLVQETSRFVEEGMSRLGNHHATPTSVKQPAADFIFQ